MLQQLNAVEQLRRFPESFVFRGLGELPWKAEAKSRALDTWASL